MHARLDFACPHCQTKHQADYDAAGREVTCNSCKKEFIVPAQFIMDAPEPEVKTPPRPTHPGQTAGSARQGTARTANPQSVASSITSKATAFKGRNPMPMPATPAPTRPRSTDWRNQVPLMLKLGVVVILAVVGVCSWMFFLKDDATAPPAVVSQAPDAAPAPSTTVVAKVDKPTTPKPSSASPPATKQSAQDVAKPASESIVRAAVRTVTPGATPNLPVPKTPAQIQAACANAAAILYVDGKPVGNAFQIGDKDLIVTTLHTLHGGKVFQAEFFKGDGKAHTHVSAVVVAMDIENDLALLRASNDYNPHFLEVDDGSTTSKGTAITVIGRAATSDPANPHVLIQGIISNPDQSVNDHHYLQTDAIAAAGNSGAAVCDQAGHAVGILDQTPGQESLGLVISGLFIKGLYLGRNDHFKLVGDFAQWERDRVFTELKNSKGSFQLPNTIITSMSLDAPRNQLALISMNRQEAIFINPKTGETLKELPLPAHPVSFVISNDRHQMWIAGTAPKMIISVDLKTDDIASSFKLSHDPAILALGKGMIWFADTQGKICAVRYTGKMEMETKFQCRSLVMGNSKNALIVASRSEWLNQIDADQLLGLLDKVAANTAAITAEEERAKKSYHANNIGVQPDRVVPASATMVALMQEQTALNQLMDKTMKILVQPNSADIDPRSETHCLLVDHDHDRLFFSRCVVPLRELTKINGQFPNPAHSLKDHHLLTPVFVDHTYSSQILAVSPDGNLAASGTHLYNIKDHSLICELPIPSIAVTFDADQPILYYADVVNDQITPWNYAKVLATVPGTGTAPGTGTPGKAEK